MVLPEPLWLDDDTKVAKEVIHNPSSLTSSTSSKDPTKLAVLRAMASCLDRFGHGSSFDNYIVDALAQKSVCLLHSYSLEVDKLHY